MQRCPPALAVSLASGATLGSFPILHPLSPLERDGGNTLPPGCGWDAVRRQYRKGHDAWCALYKPRSSAFSGGLFDLSSTTFPSQPPSEPRWPPCTFCHVSGRLRSLGLCSGHSLYPERASPGRHVASSRLSGLAPGTPTPLRALLTVLSVLSLSLHTF